MAISAPEQETVQSYTPFTRGSMREAKMTQTSKYTGVL